MDLKNYISNGNTFAGLAKIVKKPASLLSQISCGTRSCNPALAVQIELATNGEVGRSELRPNDWQLIWPELTKASNE